MKELWLIQGEVWRGVAQLQGRRGAVGQGVGEAESHAWAHHLFMFPDKDVALLATLRV